MRREGSIFTHLLYVANKLLPPPLHSPLSTANLGQVTWLLQQPPRRTLPLPGESRRLCQTPDPLQLGPQISDLADGQSQSPPSLARHLSGPPFPSTRKRAAPWAISAPWRSCLGRLPASPLPASTFCTGLRERLFPHMPSLPSAALFRSVARSALSILQNPVSPPPLTSAPRPGSVLSALSVHWCVLVCLLYEAKYSSRTGTEPLTLSWTLTQYLASPQRTTVEQKSTIALFLVKKGAGKTTFFCPLRLPESQDRYQLLVKEILWALATPCLHLSLPTRELTIFLYF